MKRKNIEIIWGIFSLIILIGGLASVSLFPVSIFIVFLILVWRILLFKKRKTKLQSAIPQEILDDFQTAERGAEESEEPTKILWDIAKSRGINKTQSGTGIQPIPPESPDRPELQDKRDSRAPVDKAGDTGLKRNYPKRLFGRGKRRT